jgi:Mrp family chromosome partitioning ATPase
VPSHPGPPPNKPTLLWFGSASPPGDDDPPSGLSCPPVTQGSAPDLQATTATESQPRVFLAAGQLPSLRQRLPLGSTLHSWPMDGGVPPDGPSSTLLVDPECRRLTTDEWQGVCPDQYGASFSGLDGVEGLLTSQTPVHVLSNSHSPLPAGSLKGRDSSARSASSRPPSIVSPVIRVSGSSPNPVVTTVGVFVASLSSIPDRMGAAEASAPASPGTRAAHRSRAQAVPSSPVASMVLVPTSTRPGAMAGQEPRPAVMRALLAATETEDRWLALEASRPSPVVVAIAEPPAVDHRTQLALVDLPDSGRAEAFRVLRHRLRTTGDPRIVAVASPYAGDESALCAAELALTYAEASFEPVLLLEPDTHRPRLARLLGINIEYCFARQMCDKYDGSPEPWRVTSVFRSNLHVLAVSPALTAGKRLFPPVFQRALSDLARGSYGQIIVVGPKVLDVAGISLIEGHVDGVLLTGPAGHTRANDLRRVARQLAPTTVLGVTLLAS